MIYKEKNWKMKRIVADSKYCLEKNSQYNKKFRMNK